MTLKQYVSLLWRWSWLIVVGTAVAGLVAFIASQNTAPLYRATSKLFVDQGTGNSAAVSPNLAPTYAEMLQTRSVFEETIAYLNLAMTTEELAAMLTISVPENTQLIAIQVEDANSERAALIANVASQILIAQNETRNAQQFAEPVANWQQEIEGIQAEIAVLQGETAVNATQLNNAQKRYADALRSLTELQVIQASEGNRLVQVELAQSDPTPILPNTTTNVIWAAVLGAVMTAAILLLARPEKTESEQTAVTDRYNPSEKAIS